MANMTTKYQPNTGFDFRESAEKTLESLKRDRDRQILSRRFGLGMQKRQTLEAIGKSFGITRERVRQIEKAAIGRLASHPTDAVEQTNRLLGNVLEQNGGAMALHLLAAQFGATDAPARSYINFLATLSGDITVMDEDDKLRTALILDRKLNAEQLRRLANAFIKTIAKIGKAASLTDIAQELDIKAEPALLMQVAHLAKDAAHLDDQWGLAQWPHVNPKSIRDKTYVVLRKHAKPLHFSDIAEKIQDVGSGRRSVTVQAVHNELIKDIRFILIGRGIYALSEWGYTPGTVADIIMDVLRQEQPLHRDEIVRRVLQKRQVKTTTIILNLQEKNHFDRVAKATYKLKGN